MEITTKKLKLSQTVFVCKKCGVEFKKKKVYKAHIPIYCSWSCYIESVSKYAGMIFTCQYCGKEFQTDDAYSGHIPKYCSIGCCGEAAKGRPAWNRGLALSDAHRKYLSEGRKNSPKCKGPNLYNWKGGDATFQERTKIYQNNRRARFMGGGKLDTLFLRHLWDAHQRLCFYCERPLTNYRCLEHLTPLSRGGKNQPFNLVYACKSCNSKKRQMALEDYAITNGKIWLVDKWEKIFIYAYGQTQEARCNIAS